MQHYYGFIPNIGISFTSDIENYKAKNKKYELVFGLVKSKGISIKFIFTSDNKKYAFDLIDEKTYEPYEGWYVDKLFYSLSYRKIQNKFKFIKSITKVRAPLKNKKDNK